MGLFDKSNLVGDANKSANKGEYERQCLFCLAYAVWYDGVSLYSFRRRNSGVVLRF